MKINSVFRLLPILLLLLSACESSSNSEDLLNAIRASDSPLVEKLVNKGVDLNHTTKNGTILHLAIQNRMVSASLLLIDKGVNVNALDSAGLTPIHWAARRALPRVIEKLIKHGCSINIKDADGYTSLNYAVKACNQEVIRILLRNGAVVYKKHLSNLSDGPFVDWTEQGMYAYYLKQDSLTGSAFLSGKSFDRQTRSFHGWAGDSMTYQIPDTKIPVAKIVTTEPIFVLGDIHGQFDRMVKNLKIHGVINEQLNWNWGKGHLVYVGDIFDRGLKVTETLWFIYRMGQEAKKAGGQVHFVFGNHELMVLENDIRYIARKYKNLCGNLGLNYTELFHPNSVLGEWLRSQNSTMQINDVLFVHGGISPNQVDSGISIEEINSLTRKFLLAGTNLNNGEKYNQLMRSHGPFWYRGYFMTQENRYNKISEKELAYVLEKLKLSTIVVGHTETDILSSTFDGRIIDVNIPLADNNVLDQALLIKDGQFYHLSENGSKKLIK